MDAVVCRSTSSRLRDLLLALAEPQYSRQNRRQHLDGGWNRLAAFPLVELQADEKRDGLGRIFQGHASRLIFAIALATARYIQLHPWQLRQRRIVRIRRCRSRIPVRL